MSNKDIIDIAKEVERCFWGDMGELMCEPEARYIVNRNALDEAIQTYCERHNCDPKRQHCRIGYWDEDDHLCDYMALYINGERQCEVVREIQLKQYIPYRSVPPTLGERRYYGNPMSIDDYDYDALDYLEGRCMASDDY